MSLVAKNSALIFSPGLVTHETLEGNVVSDLDIRERLANPKTYEDFTVFSPLLVLEEHNDLVTELSSPWQFIIEQQPFSEHDTANSFNQNYDRRNTTCSLLAGTYSIRVQPILSVEQERVIESIPPREVNSSAPTTATSKRALPGREPRDSLGAQDTGSLERKNKRA